MFMNSITGISSRLQKNYPEALHVPVIEILRTKNYVKDPFWKNNATKDPEKPKKQEDALI